MQALDSFILIGGKSSRMGSNKALLKLGDKTFVEIIADELRTSGFENICLIGETESLDLTDIASKSGLKLLPDINTDFQNETRASILGLYSALRYSESEWAFVIACDLPLINSKFIRGLRSEITGNADVIIPVHPDGRFQPFCAFYKKESVLEATEDVLKSSNWKMTNLLNKLSAKYIEFSDENAAPLFNVNTPEDLEAAIAIASKTHT